MLLLFTVFSVSIDAFSVGIALSLSKKIEISHIISVITFTFLLSLIALLFASLLQEYVSYFSYLGCFLLMFLGVKNIIDFKKNKEVEVTSPYLVGISVGTDAMVASFTLSVSFAFSFVVALLMSLFHGAFFILGKYLSKVIKNEKGMTFVSGVFLILIGIFRFF